MEKNITNEINRTEYTARIYPRNDLDRHSSTYLMDYSGPTIIFYTEEGVAKAISEYVNRIKKEYSFPEFDYKLKVEGEKITEEADMSETTDSRKIVRTTIITKLTDEECERTAKSIEDLLK